MSPTPSRKEAFHPSSGDRPGSCGGAVRRLIGALLSEKVLDAGTLERVRQLQRERGGSLSDLLVREGGVDQQALTAVLSRALEIPAVSLSKMDLAPALKKLVPRRLAFRYRVVPVSRLAGQLTVAMADPLNLLALDDIARATGLTLSPMISSPEEVEEGLQRLYGGAIADTLEELSGAEKEERAGLELLSERQRPPESADRLIRLTQEGAVVRVTHAILTQGVALKASDILVEPFERRLRIRYRVDGLFREGDSPPSGMHGGIVSRLKVMANLDIAEHRLPQDGRIRFTAQGRQVDFRLSVIPSYYGEKAALRILDRGQIMLDLERMGFDPEPMEALRRAAQAPHGMVLITGPTGSGKTTTLYALLKKVDTPERNLVTLEDPVEYDLTGVNQVSIRPEIGLTFAAGLRSILRQDPDVIMVGEIRDEETARMAIKAALTGHLVFSTLHTNDALGAVDRLKNMGVEPYLIASCVRLVGAQRLPRKVCPKCAQTFRPLTEVIERLGLSPNGKYRKGVGCGQCRGTGLDGRIGLLEAIPIDGSLRGLIEQGASVMKLRQAARGAGRRSLREYAAAQAAAGVIPLEEVARTTVGF